MSGTDRAWVEATVYKALERCDREGLPARTSTQ
jgi:hypothetical protein